MTKKLRVALEVGPKGKKVAAFAPAWPGLERGGASIEKALAKLQAYRARYEKVAKLAGLREEFVELGSIDVVEEYPGTGSTDFWGISFAFCGQDEKKVTGAELERELAILQACWTYFDAVRRRVTTELAKGPRGGGRDREHVVRHVLAVEQDWSKKLGLATPEGVLMDPKDLRRFRQDYCDAIRALSARGEKARTWPIRYLIRHTAYHAMDHAWEMEDRDLPR